ncbi:hypothetical protein IC229_22750 [Spirosoma sp. BT702]|uniref:Uncharacterized protein n=1 Tax=Spirosoma profusum TaxID=2771354 RepID=A0A927AUB8_9BACT|nr:hypothetical protein [Spirosoma profusum]MBD2703482.1 hypothetical protein [Spirosoma profusum]
MTKLSRAQLDTVAHQIQQNEPVQALQAELVDHIASMIEQKMEQGLIFPDAFNLIMKQANPQALDQLKQLYSREFMANPSSATLTASRMRLRSQRRTSPQPFQYMLLPSGLVMLILMVFFGLVSRPFSVPIGTFQVVSVVGVAGLMAVIAVRWWTTRRLRKPKRLLTA